MGVITFDPFRTLAVPGARYVKPELWTEYRDAIAAADWLLFPPHWLVDALVWGFGARVFPSLSSYHLGHDKIAMTRALSTRWPHAIPRTEIASNTAADRERLRAAFDAPFVAKTPRASEGRGVFLIETEADWARYCNAHPVLYAQERLPIDRDLRIVVIGERVVASYWRIAPPGGIHANIAAGGALDLSPAPAAALELVTDIATRLGIDHAGFDVAMIDGEPRVLEFNRLFGNRGLSEQGIRPDALIAALIERRDDPRRPAGGRSRRRRAA